LIDTSVGLLIGSGTDILLLILIILLVETTSLKSLHHFKLDPDEIWQD